MRHFPGGGSASVGPSGARRVLSDRLDAAEDGVHRGVLLGRLAPPWFLMIVTTRNVKTTAITSGGNSADT